MQPKERRAKAKADLRAKILDAARTLFTHEGYAAVTMRHIAANIGYTATAIYYHFPDKESLLRELCETDFRALSDYFKRLGRIADPFERLRKCSIAYVNFGLENPQHYRFMFMTPRMEPSPDQISIERGNPDQDSYAYVREAVQQSMDGGYFRPELKDADLIAQTLWAGLHGLVSLQLTKGDVKWMEWRLNKKTAELLTDVLLQGMMNHTRHK